jgi:hypothetical protein
MMWSNPCNWLSSRIYNAWTKVILTRIYAWILDHSSNRQHDVSYIAKLDVYGGWWAWHNRSITVFCGDWQYSKEYSLYSDWMWVYLGIYCGLLWVPLNIVMDVNNVMGIQTLKSCGCYVALLLSFDIFVPTSAHPLLFSNSGLSKYI